MLESALEVPKGWSRELELTFHQDLQDLLKAVDAKIAQADAA